MNEWEEQEDGRAESPPRGGFVAPGIPLGQGNAPVVGKIVLSKGNPHIQLRYNLSPMKITSVQTAANSAGFTEQWDFQTLQELKDYIGTIITQLTNLVDSFVCAATAISKKGSPSNG